MKVWKAFASILYVAVMFGLYYYLQPTLSLAYLGGFIFICLCVTIVVDNIFMWVKEDDSVIVTYSVAFCIILVLFIVGRIIGSSLFNATTMHQQLGEVQYVDFDDMISQIDTSQIPIVDENLAMKQADKKIGEDISLGSRVELGDAAIQDVNGEIIYVVPLEHTGFFKWFSNRTTPGYIKVSATNPNKVELVTELNGEPLNIRYQRSAWFGSNIKRYIRNRGFRTTGLTEFTFEIDNTGRPYYVVTTYKNRTLWNNPEATGVVIVDVQTGETSFYDVNSVPDWVDIVQPKEVIENQIDNWGQYVHGFWNTFTSKTDMIKKTDLTLTIYSNGNCYYFTGMTSVGSDQSCVGFIMVNTRDKSAQMCYMSGATEEAAMSSAEGLVSDFGYKAIEPLPVNVNGIPTYVIALKDDEGLIKSYAMVNVQNYNISAKGSTLNETERAYLQAVTKSGNGYSTTDEAFGYTYEGKVERISSVVESGSTQFYLILEGEEDKIFTAPYDISDDISITREGDTVKISYLDDKNGTVNIIEFDNIAFSTPISDEQEKRNELDEGSSVLDSQENEIINVNPEENENTWDSLSDEEKAKLIEEFEAGKTKD